MFFFPLLLSNKRLGFYPTTTTKTTKILAFVMSFILSINICYLSISFKQPKRWRCCRDWRGHWETEELVLASQSLPDVTAAIKELTNLAATQRVILTPSQLQTIKQGFCCVICMSRYPNRWELAHTTQNGSKIILHVGQSLRFPNTQAVCYYIL